ncbi:MAG: class I SAM-dependent methyltransferase [Vicinamibacterales bacterium]
MSTATRDIGVVRSFWNDRPCQAGLSDADDRRRYFAEISERRYGRREWHIPLIAAFERFAGKDVLEIGCGIATDGLEFARNGAQYIGVDLTPHGIELARERFGLFGVEGRFEVANAEHLPLPDRSVDHVYSFGVIHHAPAPERIVREMHRVLRPGGTFTVMLYNRTSINYRVEIMFLRRLMRWVLLPRFMPRLLSAATGFDRWKLEGHRDLLKQKMTKEQWVSVNTDGPMCPLARVYDAREAAALFAVFGDVRQEIWEFNVDHWPLAGALLPDAVVKGIGRRWGWHRIIFGEKR